MRKQKLKLIFISIQLPEMHGTLRVNLRLDLSVNDKSIEALCVEIVKKKQILELILTISNLLARLSNVSHIIP